MSDPLRRLVKELREVGVDQNDHAKDEYTRGIGQGKKVAAELLEEELDRLEAESAKDAWEALKEQREEVDWNSEAVRSDRNVSEDLSMSPQDFAALNGVQTLESEKRTNAEVHGFDHRFPNKS